MQVQGDARLVVKQRRMSDHSDASQLTKTLEEPCRQLQRIVDAIQDCLIRSMHKLHAPSSVITSSLGTGLGTGAGIKDHDALRCSVRESSREMVSIATCLQASQE